MSPCRMSPLRLAGRLAWARASSAVPAQAQLFRASLCPGPTAEAAATVHAVPLAKGVLRLPAQPWVLPMDTCLAFGDRTGRGAGALAWTKTGRGTGTGRAHGLVPNSLPSSSCFSASAWALRPAQAHGGAPHSQGMVLHSQAEEGQGQEQQQQVSLELLGTGEHAGVALLTMCRPEAKNAIGRVFLSQLLQHIQTLQAQAAGAAAAGAGAVGRARARVLVLGSQVPGVFCAGADLKERRHMSSAEAQEFVDLLRRTFTLLARLPLPTIAAVDGLALGGGLELALACDLRVCGQDAQLALPETALAIIPGAGGTQRLPRLVGLARAKELIFTGRRVGTKEALAIGLANCAAESGGALDAALAMAKQMLSKGPLALARAKSSIDEGSELILDLGLEVERREYLELLPTQDRQEGLIAFAEKRTPLYQGL